MIRFQPLFAQERTLSHRKRTPLEALVHSIDNMAIGIGDLEFPDYSAKDRAKLIEVMNTMKDTLDEAITRVVKNKKNRCEFEESTERSEVNSQNQRRKAKLKRSEHSLEFK